MFDVYQHRENASLRIATPREVGLPPNLQRREWKVLTAEEHPQVDGDTLEEDIRHRGFCFYRLVSAAAGDFSSR
jgi:hypothetical protein